MVGVPPLKTPPSSHSLKYPYGGLPHFVRLMGESYGGTHSPLWDKVSE